MKRCLADGKRPPVKRFRPGSFLDRIWFFLQWLPGVAELTLPARECLLPPTQAWTETCPDKSLRCFGCEQYLEAPVKQCVNGHTVCAKCRHVLPHCPSCRDHFIRTPLPLLDRLLSTTRLPCLYAAFGCPVLEILRRRDGHSRHCSYRPSACPLCTWESPPRLHDRGDVVTGEQLLAHHMTSAHKHHALQLDQEHVLFAWLELKKQSVAFLSCAITVDNQVFVFVMNYDINRRKFFVVLKHVGSLGGSHNSIKSAPSETRSEGPTKNKPKTCESTTISEKCQQELNKLRELKCHQSCDVASDEPDSFERTEHERIFRSQKSCEYCYLVELMDIKCIQSVRLFQSALSKEDALDLAVKAGRCLSVDMILVDRLLEPGNGQFTVKITISRIKTNVEDAFATVANKCVQETIVSEESPIT